MIVLQCCRGFVCSLHALLGDYPFQSPGCGRQLPVGMAVQARDACFPASIDGGLDFPAEARDYATVQHYAEGSGIGPACGALMAVPDVLQLWLSGSLLILCEPWRLACDWLTACLCIGANLHVWVIRNVPLHGSSCMSDSNVLV